jgi:SecD/SecF fusion protein
MKSVRTRLIFIILLLIAGLYYLYPTYKYNVLNTKEDQLITELAASSGIPLNRLGLEVYRDDVDLKGEIEASSLDAISKQQAIGQLEYLRGDFAAQIKEYRPKAIKLGLDLQGGMYLVLEVDILQELRKSAATQDDALNRILTELDQVSTKQETDVFQTLGALAARERVSLNRYWGEAGQPDAEILKDLETKSEDSIDRVLEILRNRVDQFGVSEPSISKLWSFRESKTRCAHANLWDVPLCWNSSFWQTTIAPALS